MIAKYFQQMKLKIREARKAENNRGSAMITAIVVGIVMVAFCLALILVCYTLFAQTDRQTLQTQCREIAQGVAQEIKSEIEEKDDDGNVISDSKIRAYLLDQIKKGNWEEPASEDEDSTDGSDDMDDSDDKDYNLVFTLNKEGQDELLSLYNVTVKMYYETESTSDNEDGTGSAYTVYVRVIAERGTDNDSDELMYVADAECVLTDH